MQLIDAIVRFGCLSLLLNLALLIALSGARDLVLRIGVALLVSIAAILINSSSFEMDESFRLVLKVLETPNAPLLWWFGLALFIDQFKLSWPYWLGMFAACWLSLSTRIESLAFIAPVGDLGLPMLYGVSLLLMGHLLWVVIRDASGDLLDRRRAARRWIVLGFVAISFSMAIAEITLPHAVQSFLRALILLPIIGVATWWMMPLRPERIHFEDSEATRDAAIESFSSEQEDDLAGPLHQAMVIESAYLEQGLTVSDLARRLAVPEHRLRGHINRQTGFRNFPAYVNHHRIEAAKAALKDPVTAKRGMLAIALDSGFASLATFNRVFKRSEGVTPSEFRAGSAR